MYKLHAITYIQFSWLGCATPSICVISDYSQVASHNKTLSQNAKCKCKCNANANANAKCQIECTSPSLLTLNPKV